MMLISGLSAESACRVRPWGEDEAHLGSVAPNPGGCADLRCGASIPGETCEGPQSAGGGFWGPKEEAFKVNSQESHHDIKMQISPRENAEISTTTGDLSQTPNEVQMRCHQAVQQQSLFTCLPHVFFKLFFPPKVFLMVLVCLCLL